MYSNRVHAKWIQRYRVTTQKIAVLSEHILAECLEESRICAKKLSRIGVTIDGVLDWMIAFTTRNCR
jgi:hypothetical protein